MYRFIGMCIYIYMGVGQYSGVERRGRLERVSYARSLVPDLWEDMRGVLKHTLFSVRWIDGWMNGWMGRWMDEATRGAPPSLPPSQHWDTDAL